MNGSLRVGRPSELDNHRLNILIRDDSGRPSHFDEDRLDALIYDDSRQSARELASMLNQSTKVPYLHSKVQKLGVRWCQSVNSCVSLLTRQNMVGLCPTLVLVTKTSACFVLNSYFLI